MSAYAAIQFEQLPASIQEIAEVIGVAETLRLVEIWGGSRMFIPKEPDGTCGRILMEKVGQESARLLIARYGGEAVYIPLCAAAMRAARNRVLVDEYDQGGQSGQSAAALARKYRLSEKTVYGILNRPTTAMDRQLVFNFEE